MKEWEGFLSSLEAEFSRETLEKWMPSLTRFDAANIYLTPLDSFQANWYKEHIAKKVLDLKNQNGRRLKVHLLEPPPKEKPKSTPTLKFLSDPLDADFTLENFASFEGNALVLSLLKEKASFNPIYFFGPSGSGKTHLLTALAKKLLKEGKKVFFIKAEHFAGHVVQAMRLSQMREFRKVYREIDALFVDDIHLFAKKTATQEEFFHTFNTLHTEGKSLFFSADKAPGFLKEIEPRLTSRFEWGIALEIKKAPLDLVLEKKALLWNFPLTSELKSWIIHHFPKEPILALQALSFRSPKSAPPLEKAKILLQDLLQKESEKKITPEEIIEKVASEFELSPEDLIGKSQMQKIASARQIAMYYCRSLLHLPYKRIGEIFSRDHSTVMSSVKLAEKTLEEKKLLSLEFP